MTTMLFEDLPSEEQEEFYSICEDAALDPDDFNVSFTEEIAGDADIKTSDRAVVVQSGSTVRAYENDVGTAWTVAFKEDVKAGVFGG